jgi:hypothetical protein
MTGTRKRKAAETLVQLTYGAKTVCGDRCSTTCHYLGGDTFVVGGREKTIFSFQSDADN